MPKLTRKERHELTQLQARDLPMSRTECDRYCHLAYQDEQAFGEEMARFERWERRRPALRTLADVLFWLCAVPLFVLTALNGAWLTGSVLIGAAWLVLRCDWTFFPWTEPR